MQEALKHLEFNFKDLKDSFEYLKIDIERNNFSNLELFKSILRMFKTQENLNQNFKEMNNEINELITKYKEQMEAISKALNQIAKERK